MQTILLVLICADSDVYRYGRSEHHVAEQRHAQQSAVLVENSTIGQYKLDSLSNYKVCLCRSSMATRIAYAFILLVNSIVSWVMLTPWAWRKLHHLTLNYMEFECDSDSCYGWFAVHRINFALALFHFVLGFLLIGVQNTRDSRAALQNGFWGPKVAVWAVLVVLTFFIPEGFFLVWGNYFALVGAMLFLLLGLILLVDLAHTWAELCLKKIEDEDSRTWRGLLIGSTLGMYVASFAMTIVMYIYFAGSGCSMNQAAITVR